MDGALKLILYLTNKKQLHAGLELGDLSFTNLVLNQITKTRPLYLKEMVHNIRFELAMHVQDINLIKVFGRN